MLKETLKTINGLGEYYRTSSHETKIQLLCSIFLEMIEFDGVKCRTPYLNEAVRLCLSADKGYSENKNWKPHEKLEVSSWVEPERFELSSKQ